MVDEMIRLAMQKDLEDVSDRLTEVEEEMGDMSSSEEFIALEQKVNDLAETAATEEYVDAQIQLVTSTGIPKLMVYELHVTATVDDQTDFEIALDTFDTTTDTIMVQSNGLMLFPEVDYTVNENVLSLNTGVATGTVVGIYVFKNVPLGDDGSVSGSVIGTGTLPLNRLAEMPTAEQVGALVYATNLFATYEKPAFVYWDANTLNTPFKAGLTDAQLGFAIIHGAYDDYQTVVAWQMGGLKGNNWIHVINNGSDFGWHDMTAFLPLTGGKLNGSLQATTAVGFSLGEVADYGMGELQIRMKDRTNNANIRYISMDDITLMPNMRDSLKLVDFKDGYYTSRKIFGEHNKPSGTYTGNGDATQRTISTGGLSNLVLVYTSASPYRMAIVSNAGFIGKNGTTVIADSYVYGTGGQLTIQTTNSLFNENGVTYYWQVL